jgi:hypothetical protein
MEGMRKMRRAESAGTTQLSRLFPVARKAAVRTLPRELQATET